MRKLIALLIVGVVGVVGVVVVAGCSPAQTKSGSGDRFIADAFANHQSGVTVTDTGVVTRVLPDDNVGGRHQRFILRLASGQTLLIAHNIDIAARVTGLMVGDTVEFSGQYEWNDQGGVVHWTHHDPSGQYPAGWLRHSGVTYQ
jgi:hypothetical protein